VGCRAPTALDARGTGARTDRAPVQRAQPADHFSCNAVRPRLAPRRPCLVLPPRGYFVAGRTHRDRRHPAGNGGPAGCRRSQWTLLQRRSPDPALVRTRVLLPGLLSHRLWGCQGTRAPPGPRTSAPAARRHGQDPGGGAHRAGRGGGGPPRRGGPAAAPGPLTIVGRAHSRLPTQFDSAPPHPVAWQCL